MKARELKKLLNNTSYNISNHREYIAVGSSLCHDLISVNKQTLKIKYALGGGKDELRDNFHLLFIWHKLQELIDNGKIKDIIEGVDVLDNPLPVYTYEGGSIIETTTDAYGWPNTTVEGYCMYGNIHFDNKEAAIKAGIREYQAGIEFTGPQIAELEDRLIKAKAQLAQDISNVASLKNLLHEITTDKT